MSDRELIEMPGSEIPFVEEHMDDSLRPDPEEILTVTIHLKPKPGGPRVEDEDLFDIRKRVKLPRHQKQGADPRALEMVVEFAQRHGLEVMEAQPKLRSMVLSGPLCVFEMALGVSLFHTHHRGHRMRVYKGKIHLPPPLLPFVESVAGLSFIPAGNR